MDDDKINPPKPGEAKSQAGKSRKRPAPTIDLKASRVTDTPVVDAAPETAPPLKDETVAAVQESPSFQEPPQGEKNSASPESPASQELPQPPTGKPSAPQRGATIALAALSGTLAAAMVVGASWYLAGPGGFSNIAKFQSAAKADMETLNSRVSKIESRPAQSAATSAEPAATSAAAVSATDPALVARMHVLEKSIASLRDDITAARGSIEAIKSAPREVTAPSDLKPIEDRIAKIEQATTSLAAEVSAPAKPAQEDPRIRIAAVAATLDTSARTGEPYAATLANVRTLVGETSALKPLDGFADKGIPSASALNKELLALLPQLSPKPAAAPAPSTIMERLQQGASSLVQVKRTDQPANETAPIVARIAAAAQRDDLAAARREVDTLPATARAPLQAWNEKAEARDLALAASRQFVSDMTSALSKQAVR